MVIGLVSQQQIEALSAIVDRLDARGLEEESRKLREVLAQLGPAPQEVPASAAAQILAVTPQTIRNWARAGILPGRRDRTGHFYIRLDAVESALRLRQTLPDVTAGAISDDEIDAEIQAVRAERHTRTASER